MSTAACAAAPLLALVEVAAAVLEAPLPNEKLVFDALELLVVDAGDEVELGATSKVVVP